MDWRNNISGVISDILEPDRFEASTSSENTEQTFTDKEKEQLYKKSKRNLNNKTQNDGACPLCEWGHIESKTVSGQTVYSCGNAECNNHLTGVQLVAAAQHKQKVAVMDNANHSDNEEEI